MSIADTFMAELGHEAALTRKTLDRVSEESLAFKPHEKSMAMGTLAAHIAEIPGWGTIVLNQDVFDFDPDQYTPPNPKNPKDLVDLFDRNAAAFQQALGKKDDATLTTVWKMTMKGKTVMEMPRTAVIRTMLLNHMIHHRAQLGVYLRLQGLPVPATYGPSADEQGE